MLKKDCCLVSKRSLNEWKAEQEMTEKNRKVEGLSPSCSPHPPSSIVVESIIGRWPPGAITPTPWPQDPPTDSRTRVAGCFLPIAS